MKEIAVSVIIFFFRRVNSLIAALGGPSVMPFEHACFVSYRHHEQSQLAERFIIDLFEALRNEVSLMVNEDVYLDRDRMQGGTFFNPALAGALCKSICMIVVYTPTYFSRTYPYCAREYHAMETLERRRLQRLQGQQARESGFIIPIVLRGVESLPPSIRAERHYYSFERFSLTSRAIARNPQFERYVREIAGVIHTRRQALAPYADELTSDCQNFVFPTEAEVLFWLDTIVPLVPPVGRFPFPGGTGT